MFIPGQPGIINWLLIKLTPKGVVFTFFYPHVCCMQSAPRRRSYPRAPTIRCSSCCTSCPPPAAMLWSCSQSPLCSQVPPFTCPDSAFHTSHVLPFALSRQCLSQFAYTACRALQALPAMAPRDCFSQVQRCLLLHWHLCPVPCLLLLSTPH
jgi:hypothetical protein